MKNELVKTFVGILIAIAGTMLFAWKTTVDTALAQAADDRVEIARLYQQVLQLRENQIAMEHKIDILLQRTDPYVAR